MEPRITNLILSSDSLVMQKMGYVGMKCVIISARTKNVLLERTQLKH